jgi:menaquinone-dependent protoporphyrinogen IX oxidase
MKALILYRSHYGNTKQVAEAIAKQFGARGVDAVVTDLRRKLRDLEGFDAMLIGAPTRMARVTHRALSVLKRLAKKGWGRKPLAVFDTYGPEPATPEQMKKTRKWIIPGAAGLMQQRAQELALNVYGQTLRCEVQGMKGPLKDGQLDKAAAFAGEFAATIKGKT